MHICIASAIINKAFHSNSDMKEFLECAEPGNSENAVNSLVNSLEVINT